MVTLNPKLPKPKECIDGVPPPTIAQDGMVIAPMQPSRVLLGRVAGRGSTWRKKNSPGNSAELRAPSEGNCPQNRGPKNEGNFHEISQLQFF